MRQTRHLPQSLALAVLTACGGKQPDGPAPRWLALDELHRPRPLEELAQRLEEQVRPPRGGRVARGGKDGSEVWFELPLAPELWTRDEKTGAWRTPRPGGGAFLAGEPGTLVVANGERKWKQRGTKHIARQDAALV